MNRLILIFLLAVSGAHALAAAVPLRLFQEVSSQAKDKLPVPTTEATNHAIWQSSITLGFSLTRGNSDTLLATATFQTQRISSMNEWLIEADSAYGEDHSVKNNETLHGYTQFNHFFARQMYTFVRMDGLRDGINDTKYRFVASPGLGCYLLRQTNVTLALETGPSLVKEQQGETDQTYAAWRFAERFEYKLNSTARLWHSAELIPEVNKTDNFIVNADIGIESTIDKNLCLRVYLQNNYVSQPAHAYQKNDLRIVSGVSYKF